MNSSTDAAVSNKVNPVKNNRQKPKDLQSAISTDILSPVAKRRCLAEIQNKSVASKSTTTCFAKKATAKNPVQSTPVKKRKSRSRYLSAGENAFARKTLTSCQQQQVKFSAFTSPKLPIHSSSGVKKVSKVTIADVFPSIRKYGSRNVKQAMDRRSADSQTCNCYGRLTVCRKCLAR